MEKKMRRILTAGSVCLIPVTITFPTVSYKPAIVLYALPPSTLLSSFSSLPSSLPAGSVHVLDTKQFASHCSDATVEETKCEKGTWHSHHRKETDKITEWRLIL